MWRVSWSEQESGGMAIMEGLREVPEFASQS